MLSANCCARRGRHCSSSTHTKAPVTRGFGSNGSSFQRFSETEWLRIVVLGQQVPPVHGELWESISTAPIQLQHPAAAAWFFGTWKNERVHRTAYPTRERARADIAQYIELRYNSRRIHSGLGYCTPQEVHDAWLESQEAA